MTDPLINCLGYILPAKGTYRHSNDRSDSEEPENFPRPPEHTDSEEPLPETDRDVHPWRRFFARHIDYILHGYLLAYSILYTVGSLYDVINTPYYVHQVISAAYPVIIFAFIETIYIYCFSTTPGKWVLGLSVRSTRESMTFRTSLERSLRVLFRGVFFGIPYLNRVANYLSYRDLKNNGSTRYDRKSKTAVEFTGFGEAHKFLGAVSFLVMTALTVIVGIVMLFRT